MVLVCSCGGYIAGFLSSCVFMCEVTEWEKNSSLSAGVVVGGVGSHHEMLEARTVTTFLKVCVRTDIREERLLNYGIDHFRFAVPIPAGGDGHQALGSTLLQKNLLRQLQIPCCCQHHVRLGTRLVHHVLLRDTSSDCTNLGQLGTCWKWPRSRDLD